MREFLGFIATTALGIVITAVTVLTPSAEMGWRYTLCVASVITAAAAAALLLDILRKRRSVRMLPLAGMAIFALGFVGCLGWYLWPTASTQAVREPSNQSSLAGLTNAMLKERANGFAQKLMKFGGDFGTNDRSLDEACREHSFALKEPEKNTAWIDCNVAMTKRREAFAVTYMQDYRTDAVLLREELQRRLGGLSMPESTNEFETMANNGAMQAFEGRLLTGVEPLSAAGNLLQYWASQLP